MKNHRNILYSEDQRFNQPWLWALLISVLITSIVFALKEIITEHNLSALLAVIIPMLVILLLRSFRLRTEITPEGIGYRFSPFHSKMQRIPWVEVKSAYVRQYNPIGEFGGWGIRYGMGNGTAYNVRGNMGLQLELTNGKKILIGTQQPEELNAALSALGR